MMWGYGLGAAGMWVPGMLITLLMLAGIIVLIVLVARSSGGQPTSGPNGPDVAGRILDERLARGEITIEQYQELRSTLHQSRRS